MSVRIELIVAADGAYVAMRALITRLDYLKSKSGVGKKPIRSPAFRNNRPAYRAFVSVPDGAVKEQKDR